MHLAISSNRTVLAALVTSLHDQLLEFDDGLKDFSISGGSLGYIWIRLAVRISE